MTQAALLPEPPRARATARTRVEPHRTEAELIALLTKRLTRSGNGGAGEYAVLTHVRDAAGFGATRTLDVVTVSLWPSRGMEVHGYEVKSTRHDWVRERDTPAKAEAFAGRLDRFTLLVADPSIVHPGELPPTWGLMAPRGERLVQVVAAPKLPRTREQERISRSWLVCLLRAAGAVPQIDPAEVRAARTQGFREGGAAAEREIAALRDDRERYREALSAEAAVRADLFAALGLRDPASLYQAVADLERIAAAVRVVSGGEAAVARARDDLRRELGVVEGIAARLRAVVGEEG